MMKRFLLRLRASEKGAATVEFAVMTVAFFVVVMGGMDIAMYFTQQTRLSEAISAASTSAFQNRASVNFAGLQTYVQQAARPPAGTTVSVAAVCNGAAGTACTNASRTCACLSQSGTYTTAASCTATCSGTGMSANTTAGYYLTINATYTYRPVLLPDGVMAGKTVKRTITTRLQ